MAQLRDLQFTYFNTFGDNTDRLPVLSTPFAAILEGGLTELIGANESVAQNRYAASVGVSLGGTYSGEALSILLIAQESGSGSIQAATGHLVIFDADPSIAANAAAIATGKWPTVLAVVDVASGDWHTDANGGAAYIMVQDVPFHAVATLYFTFFLESAAINDADEDNETLSVNFWYKRES